MAGVGIKVAYIMNTKLDPKAGADLPIYAPTMKFDFRKRTQGWKPELLIKRDGYGEGMDNTQEDYWLFDIHAHDSTIEFAISESPHRSGAGCNTPAQSPPVYETSSFNWKNLTDSESYTFQVESSTKDWPFDVTADLAWNRFVAIRCPQTTNPVVSVRGCGQDKANGYAAIRAIGLFIGHGADNNHEFISVKTTNRLLPGYAKSIEHYDWFERDGAVDITDRTLSMYPKQLIGTSGNNLDLYKKFVTCDPKNKRGAEHFSRVEARVARGERAPAIKYTWNSERATNINIVRPHTSNPEEFLEDTAKKVFGVKPDPDYTTSFNYATGQGQTAVDQNGLEFIVKFFPSLTSLLVNVLSGNVAGAIIGLISLPTDLKKAQEAVKDDADTLGFVTAVVSVGAKWHEVNKKEAEKNQEKTAEQAKTQEERVKLVDMLKQVITTQTVDDEITAV